MLHSDKHPLICINILKPSVWQGRIPAMVLNLTQGINYFVYLLNALGHWHYVIPDIDLKIYGHHILTYTLSYVHIALNACAL